MWRKALGVVGKVVIIINLCHCRTNFEEERKRGKKKKKRRKKKKFDNQTTVKRNSDRGCEISTGNDSRRVWSQTGSTANLPAG